MKSRRSRYVKNGVIDDNFSSRVIWIFWKTIDKLIMPSAGS